MVVCYFGIYDPNYTRNRELIRGLKENGVQVIECRVEPAEKFKYWQLFKKHSKVKNYDVMIVGFPGHPVILLAKLICRKPIIFDVFLSLYDSIIFDRKSASRYSLKALKYWLLDWVACRLADKLLLDTAEHIKYFVKTFGLKEEKFKRILVGADDSVFYPRDCQKNTDEFLAHFHGTCIPLQGIEYIVKAAKILEEKNVKFNIIGRMSAYQEIIDLSKTLDVRNVNFIDFIPQTELAKKMAQADICLGFFGDTPKAKRVGAIKISEALAMGKAVITGDNPAIREFLKDRESCLLCKMADAKDLARKILELKNNPALKEKIAQNGHRVYQERLTPKALGKELKNILNELQ